MEPLRELKYAGVITALGEVESAIAGKERITGIQIIGAVKETPEHRE